MSTRLTPPLKYHGGKHDLASWIIGLMPPRCANPNKPHPKDNGWLHYVEPYFGGGSVMLALDPEGISEVANDINDDLMNFWSVLANERNFPIFHRHVLFTPFSKPNWKASGKMTARAAHFFIHVRQCLAGRQERASFASITRNRTRRGTNEQVSAWLNAVEGLPEVHERLKRVLILDEPAVEVIKAEDGPRTLFYLDPPYMHETRRTTENYGNCEMTEDDHVALLDTLAILDGRFLLSGYRSKLYDRYARQNKWVRHEMRINNHAAGGSKKRIMTECIWTNY